MSPGTRRVLPALVAVLAVAGTGLGAVLATSLGLVPLFGRPDPGVDGYTAYGADLALGVRETLLLAGASTALAALVGLLLAGVMLTGHGVAARVVQAVAVGVVAVPHLVGAASVGLLLSDAGMAPRVLGVTSQGWPPLVAGPWPVATVLELAWKESAFVALVVVVSLRRDQRRRIETAAVLGAGRWQRWTRVLVPAAAPALAASSLVVVVYVIGSYEVAALLGRSYPEPLPVLAFRLAGSLDLTARPAAAATAVVSAGLALAVALLTLLAAVRLVPRLRDGLAAGGRR